MASIIERVTGKEWKDLTEDEKDHMRFIFPGIAGEGKRFLTKEESDELLKRSQESINRAFEALNRFIKQKGL